ncbi:MAG: putative transporter permease protein y4oQ [Frondihabitans sp.]|nr:putative transporter permease protein y4oQ [Frondihabitans sp.]
MTSSLQTQRQRTDLDRRQRPPTGIGERRKRLSSRNRPLWMLLPAGILIAVVIIVPLIIGVALSTLNLTAYTLRSWYTAPFTGVQNYVQALSQSGLLSSIGISVAFALIVTAITLPIGVIAAIATQNAFRGRAVVRSVFLIPYVLPVFVTATVWRTILQPTGIANHALSAFGIDGGLWLNGPNSFGALVFVAIWMSWPFIYLLALAGLQGVDAEVHEAAAIDGALWWAKLRYVIFPYLRGPISLAIIISILHNINDFTLPFVMFGVPTPANVQVLPVLTYIESFQSFRFGVSAAMAIVSLVIVCIPLFVYLRAVRLDSGDERVRVDKVATA